MTVQIDKLDFIRINNFCSSKDTIERMKRLTIDWRKYLQNTHELSKPNDKKQTVQLKNGQNISIDTSPNEI